MKLVVAILLLAAVAVAAKLAAHPRAPGRVASATTSLSAPARIRPTAGTVGAVRFSGPKLRAPFLAEVVSTRAGEPLDVAALHSDRLRIVAALVARGHLDAAAGEPVVRWSDGVAFVEFPVVAGTAYVVRGVRVEGPHARTQRTLATVPTLDTGHQLSAERVDANVAGLRAWLARRDIRSEVTVRFEIDRFSGQVDVVFTAN